MRPGIVVCVGCERRAPMRPRRPVPRPVDAARRARGARSRRRRRWYEVYRHGEAHGAACAAGQRSLADVRLQPSEAPCDVARIARSDPAAAANGTRGVSAEVCRRGTGPIASLRQAPRRSWRRRCPSLARATGAPPPAPAIRYARMQRMAPSAVPCDGTPRACAGSGCLLYPGAAVLPR